LNSGKTGEKLFLDLITAPADSYKQNLNLHHALYNYLPAGSPDPAC